MDMEKKGGNWCSAPECHNSSKSVKTISFFRFPKDSARCKRWVILCRREDLMDKNATYLYNNCRMCSQHFEDIMFSSPLRNRLLPNAEPTIFNIPNPPNKVSLKRKLPSRRCSSIVKKRTVAKRVNIATSKVCSQPSVSLAMFRDHTMSIIGPLQNGDQVIKTEPLEDDEFIKPDEDDGFIMPVMFNFKCENKQNYSSCPQSVESKNFENTFPSCSTKQEPENSPESFKEEIDIEIEEHKPGWEAIRRKSNVGIFKAELDPCDGEEKFHCDHCPYKTKRRYDFVKHYKRKHKQFIEMEVYKCNECQYESGVKNDLANHYRDKHSKHVVAYKCQKCSYQSKYNGNLSRHYKREHVQDAEVYKCHECSYQTIYKGGLSRHFNIKHAKDVEMYKCRECSYQAKAKDKLRRHQFKHDTEAKVYKCAECSIETKSKHLLSQHQIKHDKEAEVYKCQKCSYQSKYKRYLARHYKTIHTKDVEMYKCQECSYQTKAKGNLRQHYQIKHDTDAEVYKCDECSFETRIRLYLTRHYKWKHSKNAEMYKCQECTFETKYKSDLTKHYKRKHSINQ